jgi:FAD/FMN-containing dehydrogenase
LNEELKHHGLVFPVKPASHRVCHIGGAAATNAAGERAIKYGKMSEWIESVEVVLADGKVMWTEPEPFVGSEGIYGVITKLKLKLTKPAKMRSISVFDIGSNKELLEKIKELRSKAISIEFINKKASEIAGFGRIDKLLVEFEDESGEIKDKEKIEKLWEQREGMGPILTSAGYVVMEDPRIPEEKMGEFLDWLEERGIPAFGHVAYGIVHPRFKRDSGMIEELFVFVQKIGGEVSGEHGIGLTKKKYLDENKKAEIKKLKEKYDPKSILNRGKVI